MLNKKICIIEDDPDIVEMLEYNLKKEGFKVVSSSDGQDGVKLVEREHPDLVILDLMLPGIDGLEVCRQLRSIEKTATIPILMLTAKSQETDKVVGLEMGADDYVTKPFSPREVLARIKAILRRYETPVQKKRIDLGNLIIDTVKHQVIASGEAISLTPTEFRLLEFLASRAGVVLSREKILDGVFGYDSSIYDRTIDAHMKSLRKKLGDLRNYIETIRGVGYRFKEVESEE